MSTTGSRAVAAAGYSGTPLAKKLGIGPGATVLVRNGPEPYREWLAPLPQSVVFATRVGPSIDIAHLFLSDREVLARELAALRKSLRPDAALWISWPKKASKLPTTISEDVIRELALPMGWVDVKVCAVSEVWSGLKLVVRKALRG